LADGRLRDRDLRGGSGPGDRGRLRLGGATGTSDDFLDDAATAAADLIDHAELALDLFVKRGGVVLDRSFDALQLVHELFAAHVEIFGEFVDAHKGRVASTSLQCMADRIRNMGLGGRGRQPLSPHRVGA
jgi:hypothetical protein